MGTILLLILEGVILGISVSAPVGPIGVLCIQRTLNKGRNFGLVSALGAALADTFYAVLAAFGISFVGFDPHSYAFRLIGGTILIIVGVKMFFTNPIAQIRKPTGKSTYLGYFVTTFFLTLMNPLTVVFFVASFATLGLNEYSQRSGYLILVVFSVLLGALLWWFSLVYTVNAFRKKFRLRNLWWINKISGLVITLLAAVSIILFFIYKK